MIDWQQLATLTVSTLFAGGLGSFATICAQRRKWLAEAGQTDASAEQIAASTDVIEATIRRELARELSEVYAQLRAKDAEIAALQKALAIVRAELSGALLRLDDCEQRNRPVRPDRVRP